MSHLSFYLKVPVQSDCARVVSPFRPKAKPPKTTSMSVQTSFFFWAFDVSSRRGGALLFVCVMYQCVISDRGSARKSECVLCGYVSHRSALRQLILLRWQTVMEGGERAALTPDPRVHGTVTHCPTLTESIDPLWMDGWRQRHTQTHTRQRGLQQV